VTGRRPDPVPRSRILLVGDDGGIVATALGAHDETAGAACEPASTAVDALRCLRLRDYDVVITDPRRSMREALALVGEIHAIRRSTRVIALAADRDQEDIIAALRAHVFASFSAPVDLQELARMTAEALRADDWRSGIEVISGVPEWISLRVSSRRVTAERLVRFMTEYRSDLPDTDRDDLIVAFREMLLNAMEHGAGFDPDKIVEVSAARTSRAIVYYLRDPGPGFDRADLAHAASGGADPLAHFDRRAELGMRPGGFGLLLVRSLVDEVVYNERGNEVMLIKYTDR
jgi:anti-sigma regulatory factor (Ser/Thr protein kinase)/CheY-like chemotaxis protein